MKQLSTLTHAHFIFLVSCAAIIISLSTSALFGQGNNGNINGGKPPIGSLGPVNLPYWKLIGNSIDSGAFAGTTNNFPFKIKVNNALRASFTNSGMDLDGNLHSTFAGVDSILTAWTVMLNDALSAKTVNAEQYFQNDTLVNLVGMQSAIAAHYSSLAIHDSLISGITSSQWQSTGFNSISYTGNATVNGTFQTNNINTANITISDKISTKTAEFDTLRVAERMEVEKYIQSDTLHALSSLEVNNSLKLVRDITVMYAEVSTKDTAVALMLQKDASATVAIGAELIQTAGEAKLKLTVSGNTKLDGALNVSGNISTAGSIDANCVTTSCLNVSGETNFSELLVNQKIKTARIVPLDGDSLIHFGNNSIIFNDNLNTIFPQAVNTYLGTVKGLGLGGLFAVGRALGSVTIGEGTGTFGNINPLINDHEYSLMVGFNSNIPTLFVGNSEGANTTGFVGIGTSNPTEKLTVQGGNVLIKGTNNFSGVGDEAALFLGDNNHYIKSVWGEGVKIGSYQVPDAIILMQGNGQVGIGTATPDAKFHVAVTNETDYAFMISQANNPNFMIKGNGEVYSRDIFIYAQGETIPDYVFGENYNLPGWEKEREHWMKNKHLLGMPSAAKIEKAGSIDLKEMQLSTLKKLEELYLYVDELKKENEYLKGEIEKINNK